MGESLFGRSNGGLASGLPTGVKMAAVALLIHLLMKNSRGQQVPAPSQGAPQDSGHGGGLGGLLGSIFGGNAASPPAGGPPPSGAWGRGGEATPPASGPWGQQGAAPGPASGPWGQQGGAQPANAGGGLGGLGGLLGGLLGGAAGAGALGSLLSGLRDQGLGRQVDSWVSSGQNEPVSPQELERSFDPQELDAAAQQAGTDRGTLLQEISALLPQLVDRMTPQGQVPEHSQAAGNSGIDDLLQNVFGSLSGGGRR
ncbi:YidB family protein [Roseicella frigidaeris]|uniref:YidB family protein n=1 Tax=Roseicella frigidaeris TaxID=2230885 RepID=UPI001402BC79|nr:YidB family protein [Roseicella frigidaeris]